MKISVIAIVLVMILGACKKDHLCVCGVGVNGVSTSIYATASKAKKSCETLEIEYKTVCELE